MIIVVNARLLLKGKLEGIGWFTYETLKRITQNHPEHAFYFLFDRKFDNAFIFSKNVIPVIIPPQARHPLLFYIWFEYSVSRILKKLKADIFISPDGYLSLKSNVPQLAVIHDLNFEQFPKDLPRLVTRYFRYFFPRFARKAKRIATVSEFSKKDIQERYHIPAEKIDVVYNGVNAMYHPVSDSDKMVVREKYTGGCEYFIFVGALHPRKNLKNLFLAFELFRKNSGFNHKLLIVGARKWWTKDIDTVFRQMEYKDDVIFTGRLGEEELNSVLASASALTYVSYFEGFGIPILEAFRCEVPVITSNVTSMPEVAGNAALLTDPFNPASIADAMTKVASNKNLCDDLLQKASVVQQKFSWDHSADLLWNSIEKVLYQGS